MRPLEQAIGLLARFLEEQRVPYMVIGGVANLVWGQPRATIDVDASVLVEKEAWTGLLEEINRIFRVIPKDPLTFLEETHVLPVETAEGTRIDLLWARLPYELKAIARATYQEVAGHQVRVCRPEDLIIHKILSERSKDQEDIKGIVHHQGPRLDRRYLNQTVQALSQALDRRDLLDSLESLFT